jgi:hypothetical protein
MALLAEALFMVCSLFCQGPIDPIPVERVTKSFVVRSGGAEYAFRDILSRTISQTSSAIGGDGIFQRWANSGVTATDIACRPIDVDSR